MNKTIYICDKTLEHIKIYSNDWKKLNPDYTIELYDNQRCEDFLLTCFGKEHQDVFNKIPDGPIKADFWRICIIYYYGGVYVDADFQPLVPLDDFLEKNVDLITCCSYHYKYNFNPNFIASYCGNIFLKKCIDWYLNNKLRYSYWDWSIMEVFNLLKLKKYNKQDNIYLSEEGLNVQVILECSGNNHHDAHNIYKGVRVFNNRYINWNAGTHQFN